MAEFPGFGRHSSFAECHLLDFLPVRCDACLKDFCGTHYPYESHRCESSYRKDVQVPVCPLCGKPVPVARGELPDERVSRHIDTDCKSDPALSSRGKIYTSRCSLHGCKKRELVPIQCKECGLNFCVKHRFPSDHDCTQNRGNMGRPVSQVAKAALARQVKHSNETLKPKPTARLNTHIDNGPLSEDEALARAIEASLDDAADDVRLTREQLDAAFAEQLQRDEYMRQPRAQRVSGGSSSDRCALS
ncbi:AN1-type zinc finger protein 2B [Toxocara canis]|uniref:AN1-type zinc finger protein 2B n=1 Tax=Toxocara canis TaxID=6265 RepID=A0A0B2VZP4_TOXCA|nr:AN1-type zinc finger protein 2B [Toxocara canis]